MRVRSEAVIVVDLGCKTHHGRDSVRALIDKYHPWSLFGFDPLAVPYADKVADTLVVVSDTAAWVHNGVVAFHEDGWESRVNTGNSAVPCFDLVALVAAFPGMILKMDVEGAEYALLERLAFHRVWPATLLIEWHDGPRPGLLAEATCTIEEWWM